MEVNERLYGPDPGDTGEVAAELSGPLGMTQSAILALIDYPSSPQYVKLGTAASPEVVRRLTEILNPSR